MLAAKRMAELSMQMSIAPRPIVMQILLHRRPQYTGAVTEHQVLLLLLFSGEKKKRRPAAGNKKDKKKRKQPFRLKMTSIPMLHRFIPSPTTRPFLPVWHFLAS
jgi:hypothetical protein